MATSPLDTRTAPPMPAIYLSHGAPPLADDTVWTDQLSRWATGLPRPTSILVVSAHWEEAPLTLGATTTVPLVYDFWGFPERYYDVTYPAPGAPARGRVEYGVPRRGEELAHAVGQRGLDHGAYVPLVEMFPSADVPTLQISMPTLDPAALFDLGRRLRPLRDEGVLILGSGFTTHNLGLIDMHRPPDSPAPEWSAEFDDWAERAVASGDVDDLIDFANTAPAATLAHPRTEHLAPLFVTLGASDVEPGSGRSVIDGFWYGLSKRSWQFS